MASAFPLPYPKFRAFTDIDNLPLVGGKLYSYETGTLFSTPKDLYADSDGSTPLSNPVVLDSNGEATIYGIGDYDLVLKDSSNVQLWTAEGVNFGGGSTAAASSEWISQAGPFTYLSGTTFSVVGDQTSTYQVGRRIKFTVTGGTDYALITNVSFSGNTTVTISYDGIPLDNGLSAVAVSILGITPNQETSLPFWSKWFVDINGNAGFNGTVGVDSLNVTNDTYLSGNVFITNGLAYRPLNLQTHSLIKDEFFGGAKVSTTEIGELGWGMQSSGETIYIDSEANHPGIVRMTTTGVAYLTQDTAGSTQGPQLLPTESWETVIIARPNVSGGVDANTLVRMGWFKKNSTTTDPPTDGIYIERLTTDANWNLVTRSGSAQQKQDTGVPYAATWFRFKLRLVSTGIIGLTIDNNPEVTCTTHIPSIGLTAYFFLKRSVSGTKTLDIDYWDTFFNAISR